jgi:hypothetical protein
MRIGSLTGPRLAGMDRPAEHMQCRHQKAAISQLAEIVILRVFQIWARE